MTCPTLVVYGSKTYPVLKHASRALADVLPDATLVELPGQNHNVSADAIVPLVHQFASTSDSGGRPAAAPGLRE